MVAGGCGAREAVVGGALVSGGPSTVFVTVAGGGVTTTVLVGSVCAVPEGPAVVRVTVVAAGLVVAVETVGLPDERAVGVVALAVVDAGVVTDVDTGVDEPSPGTVTTGPDDLTGAEVLLGALLVSATVDGGAAVPVPQAAARQAAAHSTASRERAPMRPPCHARPFSRGRHGGEGSACHTRHMHHKGHSVLPVPVLPDTYAGPMQPGMPDLQTIVLKAQQMQAEMQRAQEALAEAEVSGTAGGGLVTAVVNGTGELISVTIDPSVIDPDDAETLGDLIVAAVRDANRAAKETAEQAMGSVTGGLSLDSFGLGGLGLPGPGQLPGA